MALISLRITGRTSTEGARISSAGSGVYLLKEYMCLLTLTTVSPELVYLFIYLFLLFRAAPMAYRGSQARGRIGATAAGLHHSNLGSEQRL